MSVTYKGIHESNGCHYSGVVENHTFKHMIHHYTLLVSMSQNFLNKLSKKRNIIGHT